MANLAELKHLKPSDLEQDIIDASLGKDKIIPTQVITKEEVLAFCNEKDSNGLKIILPVPLPVPPPKSSSAKKKTKTRIIIPAAFKATVPLLKNEFALTTEILLSDRWFAPLSNFTFMKVNVCTVKVGKDDVIYIIVNPSDDVPGGDGSDGGDGLKVSIPFPPPGQ